MDLTPIVPEGRPVIQAYGDMGFRISDERVEGAVVVLGDRYLDAAVAGIAEAGPRALTPVLEADPPVEILLVGCGRRACPLEPEAAQALREAGIGVELMDTGAACRTFNILLAEERRVAAFLIPVP